MIRDPQFTIYDLRRASFVRYGVYADALDVLLESICYCGKCTDDLTYSIPSDWPESGSGDGKDPGRGMKSGSRPSSLSMYYSALLLSPPSAHDWV